MNKIFHSCSFLSNSFIFTNLVHQHYLTKSPNKEVIEKKEVVKDHKEDILKTMTVDIGGIKAEIKENSKNKKKLEKEEKKKQKKLEREQREIVEALKIQKEEEMKKKLVLEKQQMKEELKKRKLESKNKKDDFSDMAKF